MCEITAIQSRTTYHDNTPDTRRGPRAAQRELFCFSEEKRAVPRDWPGQRCELLRSTLMQCATDAWHTSSEFRLGVLDFAIGLLQPRCTGRTSVGLQTSTLTAETSFFPCAKYLSHTVSMLPCRLEYEAFLSLSEAFRSLV